MIKRLGPTVVGWLVRIAVVLGILGALFIRPIQYSQTSTDTAVIDDYNAVFELDRSGNLELTETLMVRLPPGKHGIYRVFDTSNPRRPNVQHPVTVESVTRNGESEMYVHSGKTWATDTIRIGNPDRILSSGTYQYVIRSRTANVFEPGALTKDGKPETTLWWWNVVGGGWQMPMTSAHVTAHLPTTPTNVECVRDKNTRCEASVTDRTLTLDLGSMSRFEPATVRVSFPAAAVAEPLPYPSPLPTIILSILGALIAGGVALWLVMRTREKPVGLPVLFEPPEGIYPALGAKVLHEVNSPYALQATLFDLAERGLLRLEGGDSGWLITVVADPAQTEMTAGEAAVLTILGLSYNGATFTLAKNKSAGETVSKAQERLNSQVGADSRPYLSYSPEGIVGTLLAWLSLALFGFLVFTRFFGGQRLVWPLIAASGAFAFVAAGLLIDRAAWTVRNPAGRKMWSLVGGFGRFMTTDSSETRFNFAQRMDLYPRYLPWALVLGSADEWAQRYRDEGVEPPIVPWLIWSGASTNYSMTSMSDSFNSTIAGAASAYAASRASSGGGGGFSGGSGGGGGGGGSW